MAIVGRAATVGVKQEDEAGKRKLRSGGERTSDQVCGCCGGGMMDCRITVRKGVSAGFIWESDI